MITSEIRFFSKIFSTAFLIFSISFFLFVFKINYSKITKLPLEGTAFFLLIISLSVSVSILMILMSKKITIGENYINIKLIMLQKLYNYKFDEIIGWREIIAFDSFGEYKTFYIKTIHKKIHMFGSREFKNYNEMVTKIVMQSKEIEISRFYNLKLVLITFVITYIILALIFLISY